MGDQQGFRDSFNLPFATYLVGLPARLRGRISGSLGRTRYRFRHKTPSI